jgi:hypothetical protein
LNYRGAVATIIGLPLAILLVWGTQAKAGGDTINVNSSNQKGGITANTANITPQLGTSQPGQVNRSLVYPDKEMLAIQLESMAAGLQDVQAAYDRCKKTGMEAQCQSVLHGIETQTALRNKLCKDNQVPRGNYGCP